MKLTQATPARERLLARLVPQPNGCWHWTGVIDRSGYGHVGYKGVRSTTVQRAVYDCFIGPIPEGHEVDHECHNDDPTCVRLGRDCLHRRCGNPEHLRLLSLADHRGLAGKRLTHCPRGHEYDDENTYFVAGRRACKTCNRAQVQAWHAKHGQSKAGVR